MHSLLLTSLHSDAIFFRAGCKGWYRRNFRNSQLACGWYTHFSLKASCCPPRPQFQVQAIKIQLLAASAKSQFPGFHSFISQTQRLFQLRLVQNISPIFLPASPWCIRPSLKLPQLYLLRRLYAHLPRCIVSSFILSTSLPATKS